MSLERTWKNWQKWKQKKKGKNKNPFRQKTINPRGDKLPLVFLNSHHQIKGFFLEQLSLLLSGRFYSLFATQKKKFAVEKLGGHAERKKTWVRRDVLIDLLAPRFDCKSFVSFVAATGRKKISKLLFSQPVPSRKLQTSLMRGPRQNDLPCENCAAMFLRQKGRRRPTPWLLFRAGAAPLTCRLVLVWFIARRRAGMDEHKLQWGGKRRGIQNLNAGEATGCVAATVIRWLLLLLNNN